MAAIAISAWAISFILFFAFDLLFCQAKDPNLSNSPNSCPYLERTFRFSIGKNNLSPPAYSIIKQSWGILSAKIDLKPVYFPIP